MGSTFSTDADVPGNVSNPTRIDYGDWSPSWRFVRFPNALGTARHEERIVDFDDLFEHCDGAVFGLLIPIAAFAALAMQRGARRSFQRICSQVGDIRSRYGLNGCEVARRLLAACGLGDVPVRRQGQTNCYHPWKREIRLRPETFDGDSLSALAAAAHEVGHAQHFAEKIWRCRLRFVFWPACWALLALPPIYAILCFMGLVPFSHVYVGAGVLVACALVVILQLPISLPLESDATRRAKKLATDNGVLAEHEQDAFERVLKAAWRTHAVAEAQRWVVFVSIALAAAGFLWFRSFQSQLLGQFEPYETLAIEDQLLHENLEYDRVTFTSRSSPPFAAPAERS